MADSAPFDAVDAGRAAKGDSTATGMAKKDRDGELPEESHDDQTLSPDAEKIKPDYLAGKAAAPIGLQAEEAKFLTNGSIPSGVVGSNSGFVPVSSVTRTQEEADAKLEEQDELFSAALTTNSRKRLTQAKIDSMSGAELRAVAHDRGYDIGDAAGTRGVRRSFGAAQAADKTLEK